MPVLKSTNQPLQLPLPPPRLQVGKPGEEQLRLWGHHSTTATVPDQVMQQIGDEHISFVFSLQVDGKAIDPEPPLAPLAQQPVGAAGQRRPVVLGGARPVAVVAAATAAASVAAGRPAVVQPQQQAAPSRPAVQQQQPLLQQRQPPPPPQQQPPQQQQLPAPPAAKENAVVNQATSGPRPAGKLALPSLKKPHLPALAGLGSGGALGGAKRPCSSLAAAVQRVAALSDSDDDFK
jgi:hypothetical protein